MFNPRVWCQRKKDRIQNIDQTAIALSMLRDVLKKARAERAHLKERVQALVSTLAALRLSPESRAKIDQAESLMTPLVTALAVLSLFGVAAQALIYGVYVQLQPELAVAAGAATDLSLVGILGSALYVGLSQLYSWELAHRIALRVAAGVGVFVAAAVAALVFSRVASAQQAAWLLASGTLTYSLLIVAEATPLTIAALASALRFAGDPARRDRKLAKLQEDVRILDDFIAWGNIFADQLTAILARVDAAAPPSHPEPPKDRDGQAAPAPTSLVPPSKPNGSAAMVALAVLALFAAHGAATAQNTTAPIAPFRCSVALGGPNAVDATLRDEFMNHMRDNSSVFRLCSQVRLTAFTDHGRFSPSIVYNPIPELTLPDCSNPPPAPEDDKIAGVLGGVQGFQQNSKNKAISLCNAKAEQVRQDNTQANQELQSAIKNDLLPEGNAANGRCIDTISALAFLAEEQPDVLIVASDFSANCTTSSSQWRPIRLQLPRHSQILFVVLPPSRGDVRVEGEAAYARASLWKRYNRQIMIKVPSELTSSLFNSLLPR